MDQDKEYAEFVAGETLEQLGLALAIYAVALGAYWIFIG
jgi:hypothetical protein